MNDRFGKPLKGGTKVLYIQNTRTSYSVWKRTIVGFTPKMVRLGDKYDFTVNPSSLIVYDWEE